MRAGLEVSKAGSWVLRGGDNSRGAQVAPVNHTAVHWPRGELQLLKERETHTKSHSSFRTGQELSECPSWALGSEQDTLLGTLSAYLRAFLLLTFQVPEKFNSTWHPYRSTHGEGKKPIFGVRHIRV